MHSVPSRSRSEANDAFWLEYLTRGTDSDRRRRRIFKHLPRQPRCRLCAAPFAGPSARLMRVVGRRPATRNPSICGACFTFLSRHHGGAEIECTVLFADIRGSTKIAESTSPSAFRALLDRFYAVGSEAVFRHGGTVDNFVGDEIVAVFLPLLCGSDHASMAVAAGRDLLDATGHRSSTRGPWVPVGVGVHTGMAWYGTVGLGTTIDITAVGDAMNVGARLASMASAGEVLVTAHSAARAYLDPRFERRTLALRGRAEPVDVVVVAPIADGAQRGGRR